jgi:hypothetical protein
VPVVEEHREQYTRFCANLEDRRNPERTLPSALSWYDPDLPGAPDEVQMPNGAHEGFEAVKKAGEGTSYQVSLRGMQGKGGKDD